MLRTLSVYKLLIIRRDRLPGTIWTSLRFPPICFPTAWPNA